MCGVFGFIANKNGGRPDFDTLSRIAKVTATRGRHAWGMAWIDSKGVLRSYKQTGSIVDSLGLLRMASDAKALIGHCRYATQGSYYDNINNHPHPCDGGWLVHNGMIPNYDELLREHTLFPTSECDSEVLGLMIEKFRGKRDDRILKATTQVDRPLVVLGLWKPGVLYAVRQGNPLSAGRTKHGTYLASLPEGLPGIVEEIDDDTLVEYT